MGAILHITFWNEFSCAKIVVFIPEGPINNEPALVQIHIMAWHQSGAKPLSEWMMVCFSDTDMHHSALALIDLTHLPLDKMAAISRWYFQMHFHEWKIILIQISLNFIPEGPIDNNQALV